ncbi:TPA: polynucleotide adenylyltransferase [Candidatus Dependentiae bacterium]|nr:MAG: Polynucleotide adenylyltransferase region [candidate division TM6 bacterium GW2011_GWE2_31_21]KKP54131.1 MAG: Polynucleotide adenylyltransferase region [candidate division TM6 bacterium GW2011_GWF2_33_332]HBS47852.1 polynucleotide adenylyltransferase [Candidatus Dependentiae bacterium]HBZ73037.1 polynucleotide adenylyltransferase [Candidatus Dependentiae bacterium]
MSTFIDVKRFDFLKNNEKLVSVLKTIYKEGGVAYLVGGSVRDLILNKPLKDLDIEVHKLPLEDFQNVLEKFGFVKLVGKQFGVLRLENVDVDWSIPRQDSKGRKPLVIFDPYMTLKDACKRRDLTINAMAIDLKFLTEKNAQEQIEVLDPFEGFEDLKNKKLKAIDNVLFLDDPLRFFRVMQFVGRFEMEPDGELNEICKKIDLSEIARERIFEELCKLFLKSRRPSLGIRWLKKIGRLKEIMPEVFALVSVQQRSDHHPEGNVFEHTMQALDAAAMSDKYESEKEKLTMLFAALCHDFGKPIATTEDLRSIGHEKIGSEMVQPFMKRFTEDYEMIKAVEKLVLYHLLPWEFVEQNSSLKAYKRLALKLSPQTNLRQLALLQMADSRGRNAKSDLPLAGQEEIFEKFMQKAKEAFVENKPEVPVLHGRDLMDVISPGKEMGELLKKAYEIQIDEGIKDKEELKKLILKKE